MAKMIPSPEPGSDDRAFLDCERLDVYRVAVEFQQTAARVALDRRIGATLRNQLDRASVSIVLCIAEGAGLSDKDRAMLKRWRSSKMKIGSDDITELVEKANEDFATMLTRRQRSQIQNHDWND